MVGSSNVTDGFSSLVRVCCSSSEEKPSAFAPRGDGNDRPAKPPRCEPRRERRSRGVFWKSVVRDSWTGKRRRYLGSRLRYGTCGRSATPRTEPRPRGAAADGTPLRGAAADGAPPRGAAADERPRVVEFPRRE